MDRPLVPASKLDLLLVVDDSAAMRDKSSILASSIGTLLRDVARLNDVHVGVLSTSLGSFGGDVCSERDPAKNGRAYLRTTGPDGAVALGAETGVLSCLGGSVDAFVTSTQALIDGVGQNGCGFEAQLETMYRFLVQPDPWTAVTLDERQRANLGVDVDTTLLSQRKAFLRPDSALLIVMLTDEDDSAVDPLAVNGQGWAFESKNFPGSKIFRGAQSQGTTAPRGTKMCETDPLSQDCTTCGFWSVQDPNCQESGVEGMSGFGYDGYYKPADDDLNVRFHRMKERYGVDPQFPVSRYVDGLTRSVVPNRANEHPTKEEPVRTSSSDSPLTLIEPYAGTPNCTNPIFAARLPSDPGEERCTLERGPRSRELVVFAVLGGVPKELATAAPDWVKILGRDPDKFDLDGIDPHMIASIEPRPGLLGPTSAETDPVHGREWDTKKIDLQYACTFALPAPRTCSRNDEYCECSPDSPMNSPLCANTGEQVRAKAYPTLRPLRVARALGERGVIGSVCSESYDTTMTILSQRLVPRLAQ